MSSPLQALRDLLNPKAVEMVGTITHADHPKYKVLVGDDSGLTLCTSNTVYTVGQRVFFSDQTILRPAPDGDVINIEL